MSGTGSSNTPGSPVNVRAVPRTLHESARRAGEYRWIEMQLFEALGRWATEVSEAAVKLMCGRHAHHHAWHAEMWEARLPVLAEMPRDEFVAPSSGAYERFVTAATAPEGELDTADLLVGVYRVLLPHLAAVYEAHRSDANPASDEPTIRSLTLILRDLDEDLREGEAMIESLLDTPAKTQRAADRQDRLVALGAESTVGP